MTIVPPVWVMFLHIVTCVGLDCRTTTTAQEFLHQARRERAGKRLVELLQQPNRAVVFLCTEK